MSSRPVRRNGSLRVAALLLLAFAACARPASSQTCTDQSFDVEAAIRKAWDGGHERGLYRIAAVAGERAVPALRRLAAAEGLPQNRNSLGLMGMALEKTLAKLGDDDALRVLAEEFRGSPSGMNVANLAFVGDDRAIAAMMSYFDEHRSEPLRFKSADTIVSGPVLQITLAVFTDIGQRRGIRDFQSPASKRSWTHYELKDAWQAYWDLHKNGAITVAPYESVSDLYLRCLAREVDWGFEDAIFDIADKGGEEALSVLRKFPLAAPWGVPTIPGNLWLALAKLGDKEKYNQILDEWRHGSAGDAGRKLAYLGGRETVGLFVERLASLEERLGSRLDEKEQCINGLIEREKLGPGKKRDKLIRGSFCQKSYEADVDGFRSQQRGLLQRLARIVKDPPLPGDAIPSPENIRTWNDWWAKNRDIAVFLQLPASAIAWLP